jgi:N-acetylglucosamine kinase-like BadF-type ATPase
MNLDSSSNSTPCCFLGLDVGGTQSRWALATSMGEVMAEGVADGFSGARLASVDECEAVRTRLSAIADAVQRSRQNRRLCGLHAGVTGIGADAPRLVSMLVNAFDLAPDQVSVTSDAELSFRAVLALGEGYLVYAGTGSIAALVDEAGVLHRAGGRGVMLDDAGGGYWIAREALRRIWRREDEQPGAWRDSPMARALFAIVGGDSSIFSARYLMEKARGEIGMLALVVAEHANEDALAAEILSDAAIELARLANAMTKRYGARRIVVAGRASQLHPLIESAMRRAVSADTKIAFQQVQAHVAAAKIAAKFL